MKNFETQTPDVRHQSTMQTMGSWFQTIKKDVLNQKHELGPWDERENVDKEFYEEDSKSIYIDQELEDENIAAFNNRKTSQQNIQVIQNKEYKFTFLTLHPSPFKPIDCTQGGEGNFRMRTLSPFSREQNFSLIQRDITPNQIRSRVYQDTVNSRQHKRTQTNSQLDQSQINANKSNLIFNFKRDAINDQSNKNNEKTGAIYSQNSIIQYQNEELKTIQPAYFRNDQFAQAVQQYKQNYAQKHQRSNLLFARDNNDKFIRQSLLRAAQLTPQKLFRQSFLEQTQNLNVAKRENLLGTQISFFEKSQLIEKQKSPQKQINVQKKDQKKENFNQLLAQKKNSFSLSQIISMQPNQNVISNQNDSKTITTKEKPKKEGIFYQNNSKPQQEIYKSNIKIDEIRKYEESPVYFMQTQYNTRKNQDFDAMIFEQSQQLSAQTEIDNSPYYSNINNSTVSQGQPQPNPQTGVYHHQISHSEDFDEKLNFFQIEKKSPDEFLKQNQINQRMHYSTFYQPDRTGEKQNDNNFLFHQENDMVYLSNQYQEQANQKNAEYRETIQQIGKLEIQLQSQKEQNIFQNTKFNQTKTNMFANAHQGFENQLSSDLVHLPLIIKNLKKKYNMNKSHQETAKKQVNLTIYKQQLKASLISEDY